MQPLWNQENTSSQRDQVGGTVRMEEIEVPSHFICPISLQLMRDPVTVSSGITYDRESIERWLFSCKRNTCPVTKLSLSDSTDLIPNHALRRLIQAWCTLNASHGIERIPTPKQPLDRTQITKLLDQAKKSPQKHPQCLQKLRSIAYLSQRNRKCLEDAGAVEFLASIINKNEASTVEADEALCLLYLLEISEASRKKLASNNIEFVESLMNVLNCGNYQSRAYSVMLMKSILEVANPSQLTGVRAELFNGVVHVLNDKISHQATKAALKLLGEVCPWGRNRIKAVEAGAVSALVELLLETVERRYSELILVVLDQLCRCAEGRAELLKHGAGLAVVSKKILRVSHVGTDRAVRILSGISRFSGSPRVVKEMLQVGVVSKLCLVLQVETSGKTKERTNEMLKLHSRVWKNSACIPPHLLSSYPN